MIREIYIISGYFDPLHIGHLEMINMVNNMLIENDELAVIVNNDKQAKLKKNKSFMNEKDRVIIMNNIKGCNEVFLSIDKDRTVCKTIKKVVNWYKKLYSDEKLKFYSVNGGDRYNEEIPEADICKKLNVQILDGFGKKIRSSSNIVNKNI